LIDGGTPRTGHMATTSTQQAERYREHTQDTSGCYDVEAIAELDIKLGEVDRLVGLVQLG